jgi:protein-tyrosine phosphatase
VTKLLFVCLGNICRSPMALAICREQARSRGVLDRLTLDSCGTGGWHEGQNADPRTIAALASRSIVFEHAARKVRPDRDFAEFDLLLAMDRRNEKDLIALGAPAFKVRLMRSFDPRLVGAAPHELDVPDPYYGNEEGFQRVYDMLWGAGEGLLEAMARGG